MKYDMNTGNLTLTVTELVSLAYPAGDIHHRAPSGAYVSRTARTAFLEAHGGEEAFTSDAPVSASVERPDTEGTEIGFSADDTPLSYHILLSDQIDGIVTENKDCPRIYHLLPDTGYDAGGSFRSRERAAHRVKAALYCIANGCSGAELSAVTVRREGGRILCEEEYRTRADLTESLREILCAVLPTLDFLVRHRTVTLPKAGEVCFPYSAMRDGQEDLIRAVYRAIRTRKRLFAQAPTGIGKTISTLYPAVRALGNGYADKIFYLTAKASTRREAFSASERLFHAGARLRTCVISAKEQVCLCEKPTDGEDACNPFDCPYADGYYERAPKAILELLQRHHGFPRETILETAREHTVCPYELSLDLSEKCDIIICDYNYIFDPQVYFRRYFGETRTFDGQYVFLIDEGHNLADRARDMYSASLSRSRFRAVRDEIPEGMTGLRAALSSMDDTFARLRLLCDDTLQKDASGEETGFFMSREAPKFLDETLGKVADVLKEARRTLRGHPYRAAVQGALREISTYQLLRGYSDERFLTMVRVQHGDVEVRLFCLDPSAVLDECLSRARATVVFSATLTPTEYFTELLGGGKNAEMLSLPSPFPRENLCVAICDGVSTRYETRAASYRTIASQIAAMVSAKAGNYIVYFPSYAYLEAVAKVFAARYPSVPLILQKRGMRASERDAFLDAFVDDKRLRVGFCVLGGSFSEGVDLPGGRLIGTAIVGVGLPGLSEEGNILRDYYENKCEQGYDYAYTFPGMNRVLQAAGRVIRTDSDRGVVVLIDDRYASPTYRALFPPHWEGVQYAGNSSSLAEIMRRFWSKKQK